MKSQDHKPTNEDKAKGKPGMKTGPQVMHPILQLQHLVGNKAVTNMIQRHEAAFIRMDADLENHALDMTRVRYSRTE